MSITATLKRLNEEEEAEERQGSSALGLTGMAAWIVEGLELEVLQYVSRHSA